MRRTIRGLAMVSFGLLAGCSPASNDGNGNSNDATDNDNRAGDGPDCAEYCGAIQGACGDLTTNSFTGQYPDFNACMAYCETWAGLPSGDFAEESGNTIGCRLSYAVAAAGATDTIARLTLCEQAGPSGGNQCGTWCDNYCYLALRNCAGLPFFTDDLPGCLVDCAILNNQGRPGVETGNNVQCRIFHLGEAGNPASIGEGAPLDAAGDPVMTRAQWHCPHAAIVSREPDGSDGPCR